MNQIKESTLALFQKTIRKKISEKLKGVQNNLWSDESRKKLSESKKGKYSNSKGCKWSDESRKKLSESKKGKPSNNKGGRYKISKDILNKRIIIKKKCSHCGKEVRPNMLVRWHEDKCKLALQ